MIEREIYSVIQKKLYKGKAIIITGPRQTGKTTLIKHIAEEAKEDSIYLNADEPDVRKQLEGASSTKLRQIIGKHNMVLVDEAQRVQNIGISLKLIIDEMKDIQLIVTGSSSIDLSTKIHESLTGRKFEYQLYPFSFSELQSHFGFLEEKRLLETRLIYGTYPDVINHPSDEKEILTNLSDTYLYKDILSLDDIRRPELLHNLLEAIALQIGSEVRYSEIAETIGANQTTVKKYIELLEKSFVVFRLRAFSRNLRNEIKRSRKIYFFDNGIRNAILRNYSPIGSRSDVGALWENYLISERIKRNAYKMHYARMWFWRTKQRQEIDLIEEADGKLSAYEFKWNPKKKVRWSKTFTENYETKELKSYNRDSYEDFLSS